MAPLGSTLHQLSRHKRNFAKLAAAGLEAAQGMPAPEDSPLTEVAVFGSNPGDLRMFAYLPESAPAAPALVVVLHGCTQNARAYDHGAGWSELAGRLGFALLMPQQKKSNNAGRCFNWFEVADTTRDQGEALSIRQMIASMVADHDIDESRIFVTGLSAGGAMTSAMLASYPELFAGGAIVAGLPYRCASNMSQALECMYQGDTRSPRAWGDLVRAASSHRGPWPRVSIWHGSADTTVAPLNAGEIAKQWCNVHGIAGEGQFETADGIGRRVWLDGAGHETIEEYTLEGLTHGTPLSTGLDEDQVGRAGPFLLEAGISSSFEIAKFWGLTGPAPKKARRKVASARRAPKARAARPQAGLDLGGLLARLVKPPQEPANGTVDIGAVITRALKAAGLMK